jgi:hypothetical protein
VTASDASGEPAWTRRVAIGCGIAVFALLAGGVLQGLRPLFLPLHSDAHYYFLQMFSLLVDGDLDFANQYAAFGDPLDNAHYEVTRGIGNAVLHAPFFYLGHVIAVLTGHHDIYQPKAISWLLWSARSATLFYACCALVFIYCNPRLRSQPAWRRWLVLASVVFGTPLWAYSTRYPLFNHVLTFFLTAGLWYFAELDAAQLRVTSQGAYLRWASIGLLIGLILTTRPELAVFTLLLLVPVAELRPRAGGLSLAVLIAGAFWCVQLGLFRAHEKATLPHADILQLGQPHLLGLLYSPRNGFFYQQPHVLLGALGLLASECKHARGRVLLACICVVLWINASVWDPWGGFSIGARRLIPLQPFVALGLLAGWAILEQRAARAGRLGHRARWLSILSAALLGSAALYGANTLDDARAGAVARGMPAPENALERALGQITAYPLLVTMQLESSASLSQVYRIASLEVLFRWPTRSQAVDRLVASSGRFMDLRVEQHSERGRSHERFYLPLHRTPAARVHVRVDPQGPVVVLWNGEPVSIIAGPSGYVSFAVHDKSAASSAWLETIIQPHAQLREIVLEGPS